MISFEDIRPQLKKFVQEGRETTDYIMRVSKTPKDGIYAYEELGEIVRCKDCELEMNGYCSRPDEWNDDLWFPVDPNGYCAWGERKVER